MLLDSDDLHRSREALIQAQISHWTNLMAEDMASCCSVHAGSDEECEIPKCKHESDGATHVFYDDGGNLSMSHCKLCGEFYRKCQHEPDTSISEIGTGHYKCKHCGDFYR